MAQPNEARDLEVAIGNVIADAPEEALLILTAWQGMARRAADRIDELNDFNDATSIPLTDGGRLEIRRRPE